MALSGCEEVVARGARVLIKPNWNAASIPSSTSLAAVLAACKWARTRGAGEVIVGEGPVPVGRPRIEAYLKEMGVPGRLEAVGAKWALFDDLEHALFKDEKDLPPEVGIAKLALESDVIINLPLLKTHTTCMVTLCVKNLKWCLRPQDKMAFHRVGLLPAIVALNKIVRPQINVVDAIDGMEGDHTRGSLVHLGLLIAGRDPVAVDAVTCAQIGIGPDEVPLLRMADKAGLGVHRLDKIEIVGEPLRPRRFERAQERLKRVYPDLVIDDAGACSACGAALMDGLFIAGAKRKRKQIAMGKHAKPVEGALVLGKCLREHWATHPHVKGCPPSGHAVAEALCEAGEHESGGTPTRRAQDEGDGD